MTYWGHTFLNSYIYNQKYFLKIAGMRLSFFKEMRNISIKILLLLLLLLLLLSLLLLLKETQGCF